MLKLPLRARTKTSVQLPVDHWLEDLRGQRVGQIITRYGASDWEVQDTDGKPLAYLRDVDPNAVNHFTIALLDAQQHTLGRLHCPRLITGLIGQLQGEIYAGEDHVPLYRLQEDSLLVRMLYEAVDMVPWLSLAANYLLRPRYTLRNARGRKLATLTKEGSLLGGNCRMEPFGSLRGEDAQLITLALLALSQVEFNWKSN